MSIAKENIDNVDFIEDSSDSISDSIFSAPLVCSCVRGKSARNTPGGGCVLAKRHSFAEQNWHSALKSGDTLPVQQTIYQQCSNKLDEIRAKRGRLEELMSNADLQDHIMSPETSTPYSLTEWTSLFQTQHKPILDLRLSATDIMESLKAAGLSDTKGRLVRMDFDDMRKLYPGFLKDVCEKFVAEEKIAEQNLTAAEDSLRFVEQSVQKTFEKIAGKSDHFNRLILAERTAITPEDMVSVGRLFDLLDPRGSEKVYRQDFERIVTPPVLCYLMSALTMKRKDKQKYRYGFI
eukprot:GHVL01043068.1.p1 GENE.GHVL01043068.1~~GHVL01043068.1.p1  ORF type:complete len:292 (-),score=43.08 GHVL01043068.1:82-957(-)